MGVTGLPTSSDIYLEANGKKLAIVQSYKASAKRTSKSVEAFGETEPIGALEGQRTYTIELTRLYASDEAVSDGVDFYSAADFSLVIVKPDRRIVYTGCQWSDIVESGEIGEMSAEKVVIVASGRVETTA